MFQPFYLYGCDWVCHGERIRMQRNVLSLESLRCSVLHISDYRVTWYIIFNVVQRNAMQSVQAVLLVL